MKNGRFLEETAVFVFLGMVHQAKHILYKFTLNCHSFGAAQDKV